MSGIPDTTGVSGAQNRHVCIVSHLFPNPSEPLHGVFVKEGVRALAQYRPVSVVAPVSWFPFVRKRSVVPLEDNGRGISIKHPRYLALPKCLLTQRWRPYYAALKRALHGTNFPPALLHAHWVYPDAYATANYARRHAKKLVITVHGHRGLAFPNGNRELVVKPLRSADSVITVSTDLQRELISLGVPESRIRLIRNGFDPVKFSPRPKSEMRAQLGLPPDVPIAITVARLSPEKGLDVLIRAMRICTRTDLLLYLIGDGPLRSVLESFVKEQGLSQRIKFMGGVAHDRLNPWFSAADFFCLPSHTEGCPVVLHEALACGIPVVASSVGAIPEIINSDELGAVCPAGDHDLLAGALAAAAARTWNHQLIAEYGSRFTWDRVAGETSAVYDEVLG